MKAKRIRDSRRRRSRQFEIPRGHHLALVLITGLALMADGLLVRNAWTHRQQFGHLHVHDFEMAISITFTGTAFIAWVIWIQLMKGPKQKSANRKQLWK